MSFENLNIIEPILKALKDEGYSNPTPIQSQAIPLVLQHKDLLAAHRRVPEKQLPLLFLYCNCCMKIQIKQQKKDQGHW